MMYCVLVGVLCNKPFLVLAKSYLFRMYVCMRMYVSVSILKQQREEKNKRKKSETNHSKKVGGIINVNSNDDDGQINTVPNRPYTPIDRH